MLKKHLVLFESKDYGWIAYSTTGAEAKRILNINNKYKYNIYYIFECDLLQQYPYIMKLKAPLNQYYDCKRIIKYKEANFEENDKYLMISYKTDECNCFDIKLN
uniref:Uncharacterized protein n=1 Tax=viral metagenome TaxID=1070528 RepID=A0A6C0KNK8_9ZZZZ